ncbi:MAG: transglutaminase domain-containing protein [Hamadaea sp.]|nr:transglutaminase domain-containing protein [Hamadaea sp.]
MTATPDATLVDLRIRAEDFMRANDDAGLLALADELRLDTQWPRQWAPACAIAARRLGRADARDFLLDAIDGGFFQPELFGGDIERMFGDESDWPQLAAKVAANVPAPRLELLDWPTLTPKLPLKLHRTSADREELLRPLLPPTTSGSAWETAKTLLHWVTRRWTHANDHSESDAVEILRQVDEDGKRFACVEYSIVLCNALNAVGIPSRRVRLFQRDYHAGWGKGHVVSEAWIDDLGAWVVLDGQNGAYWTFDNVPLGVGELQRSLADGREPRLIGLDGPMDAADTGWWWTYFAHVQITGGIWSSAAFVPIFQANPMTTGLLTRDAADHYPDLAEIGVCFEARDGVAGVRFTDRHPFSQGYAVDVAGRRWLLDAADPVWTFPAHAGTFEGTVAIRTAYGESAPRRLAFRAI